LTESPEEKHLIIWRLMRMVARLLQQVRAEELEPHGITIRQAAMLAGIKVLGAEATVVGIANYQMRDPSSVSNIIIRMERMGLVKRLVDPQNRRRVHVVMTRKGEDLYEKSLAQEAIKRVLSGLTEAQSDSMIEALTILRRDCHDALDSPRTPGRKRLG
jgi:MarR family transcriptional regulator, organic hydroperoxide resistance regulator